MPRAIAQLFLFGGLLATGGCTKLPDTVADDSGAVDTSVEADTDTDADADADTDTDADTDSDTVPPIPGILLCAPGLTRIALTSPASQTIQFTATLDQGAQTVPAPGVQWIVDGPGTITAGGLYTTPADHGGLALVRAELDVRSAICTVEVQMDATVNTTGIAGIPGAFGGSTPTVSNACAPTLVYPLANSAMPGSFAAPLIQWTHPSANAFRLVLESQWTTLVVYTSTPTYRPTPDQWLGLTRYDPATTVSMRLTSGTWNGGGFSGGTCTTTAATVVEVTDDAIDGTIVYWAPPVTKTVTFSAGQPATNAVLPLAGTICTGCHTVNLANPSKMTYGPNIPGRTNLVDINAPGTVLQTWGNGVTNMKDYGAPDPTGQYVVVSGLSIGSGSSMTMYDQVTGATIGPVATSRSPTMPNWSPDGTKLVYAGCDAGATALGGSNCDLYVMTFNPTTLAFSGEVRIAQHAAGETLYYPSFSPDSRWVAYNRAEQWTDGAGNAFTSNANPKAKVMLVSASGGRQIELGQANGTGDLTNSWPRWAPGQGRYGWLAWSSKRAYGTQVTGRAQLWVTGVDFAVAAAPSGDPSRPPTWIPGQLITEGNHTPTWLPRKGD